MISFDRHGARLEYRVAGFCVHDGYVLLTRADQDRYWIFPGGRVELGEATGAAIEREILEETGHEARNGELLWVTENFFRIDRTDHHELAFIYALSPHDPAVLDNAWTHRTTDGDASIELRGFDLDRLEAVPFQPSFLKPLLQTPPETPQHLIVTDPHHR